MQSIYVKFEDDLCSNIWSLSRVKVFEKRDIFSWTSCKENFNPTNNSKIFFFSVFSRPLIYNTVYEIGKIIVGCYVKFVYSKLSRGRKGDGLLRENSSRAEQ